MNANREPRPTSAGEILRLRYVGDDPARAAEVEAERINAHVARMIYDRRHFAGLTQEQLASLAGTTPSVIRRLEAADDDDDSPAMLRRTTSVLGRA